MSLRKKKDTQARAAKARRRKLNAEIEVMKQKERVLKLEEAQEAEDQNAGLRLTLYKVSAVAAAISRLKVARCVAGGKASEAVIVCPARRAGARGHGLALRACCALTTAGADIARRSISHTHAHNNNIHSRRVKKWARLLPKRSRAVMTTTTAITLRDTTVNKKKTNSSY